MAAHAAAGCDVLSHATVCVSPLLIDHADFYGRTCCMELRWSHALGPETTKAGTYLLQID